MVDWQRTRVLFDKLVRQLDRWLELQQFDFDVVRATNRTCLPVVARPVIPNKLRLSYFGGYV